MGLSENRRATHPLATKVNTAFSDTRRCLFPVSYPVSVPYVKLTKVMCILFYHIYIQYMEICGCPVRKMIQMPTYERVTIKKLKYDWDFLQSWVTQTYHPNYWTHVSCSMGAPVCALKRTMGCIRTSKKKHMSFIDSQSIW